MSEFAFELSDLIQERRGLEFSKPWRWVEIDRRIDAIEMAAGLRQAETREGLYLQACIGAGGAAPSEAACLNQLALRLATKPLAPFRSYYLGLDDEPHPHVFPLPDERRARRWGGLVRRRPHQA